MLSSISKRGLLLAVVLLAALLSTKFISAGNNDAHLSQNLVAQLFQHSAFAHGYIHGYEEGFHWGNLDYQSGRVRLAPHAQESRASKSSYEKSFGRKSRFRAGYHRGFLAGYSDGSNGREFRGFELAKYASQGMPGTPEDTKQLAAFDAGLTDGYELGSVHGENASRDNDEYNTTTNLCSPGSKEHHSHPPLYCSGFERGYTMGYSDGYLGSNLRKSSTETEVQK